MVRNVFLFVWGHNNNNNQNNRLLVIILSHVSGSISFLFVLRWTRWWVGVEMGGRAEQSGGEGHKIHSPSFQTVTWSDLSYYLGLWIRCIIFWICHKKRSPVAPPEMQWTHVQHLDRVLRSVCLSVCWVLRNESCLHLSDAVRTLICPYYVTHSLCVLCISGPLCLIPSDWLSAQNRYKFCFGVFFFLFFCSLCIQEFLDALQLMKIGKCEVKPRAKLLWYWALLKNVWYVPIICWGDVVLADAAGSDS